MSIFGKKKNGGQLLSNTAVPLRPETEPKPKEEQKTINVIKQSGITLAEWEQRRFELMKMLVCQDRRSVVLGKLQASNRQIAENARKLADASIAELVKHPYRGDYGTGKEPDGDGTE